MSFNDSLYDGNSDPVGTDANSGSTRWNNPNACGFSDTKDLARIDTENPDLVKARIIGNAESRMKLEQDKLR